MLLTLGVTRIHRYEHVRRFKPKWKQNKPKILSVSVPLIYSIWVEVLKFNFSLKPNGREGAQISGVSFKASFGKVRLSCFRAHFCLSARSKADGGLCTCFWSEVTLEPFCRCIAHRFFHSESLGCFLIFCADDVSPTLRIFSVFWTWYDS